MKLRDPKMKALVVTALDRFEPLRIFARHLTLVVVVFSSIVGLALAAYLLVPVSYVATGTVLVGDPEPGVAQSAVDMQKTGDPADMESQLIIAHSQVVLRRALLSPKAQKALKAECMAGDATAFGGDCNDLANRPDKLVDYVSPRYGVGSVGRSRIITVSYTSPQPEVASDMANALIEAFLKEQKETVSASRETAADWLKKEANALDTEIRRLDRQIAEYRGENGLVRGTGGPATSELLTGVNQQLAAAQALEATAAARLKEINAADLGGSANATAVLESRTVGDLKQKIADIDSRLGTAATTLGPSHPRLKALVGERKALNSRLSAEIDRIAKNARKQYAAATERVAVLTKQMQAAKAEVTVAADGETSIEDLVRRVEVKRRQFADLSTRINDLEVEQRVRSGNVRLVSEADVPRKPFFPKKIPFAAAGLTLGLLAGVAAAFVAEKINPAGKTASPRTFPALPPPGRAGSPPARRMTTRRPSPVLTWRFLPRCRMCRSSRTGPDRARAEGWSSKPPWPARPRRRRSTPSARRRPAAWWLSPHSLWASAGRPWSRHWHAGPRRAEPPYSSLTATCHGRPSPACSARRARRTGRRTSCSGRPSTASMSFPPRTRGACCRRNTTGRRAWPTCCNGREPPMVSSCSTGLPWTTVPFGPSWRRRTW